jgi:hypothetical protein
MPLSKRDAHEETVEMLAAAGITVTEDGKARARQRLAEADERRTPELRDAMRAQVRPAPPEAE